MAAADLFKKLKANAPAIKRTTAEQRIAKLEKLRSAIIQREAAIRAALAKDFSKAGTEVEITEIVPCLVEIKETIGELHHWMKPHRVGTPLSLFGTKSEIRYEPKGVVLIIGPWNYPFQLVIAPLIAAVAAGNVVVIKPSELTDAVAKLTVELIGAVFSPDEVAVVEGDHIVTQELLALPFDHFFFTGSTKVGKIVAEAAAKHLASTTLELGGKSPAIVDETADLELTANRLVWGKFVNAGQTCIAPDYILVHESKQDALVRELGRAIDGMYGSTPDAKKSNTDFARIINKRNYDRLKGLLDDTLKAGAKVAIGGETDAGARYIAPTVVTGVTPDSALMSEEIFGPILPVLTYRQLSEVTDLVTSRDKPLALYVFSGNDDHIAEVLGATTAGGTCVNTTTLHFANSNLPFGGVGASGSGNYHGFFGFKAFSHERAVLRQGRIDMVKQLYPPYGPKVAKTLKLMRKLFT